MTQSAIARFWVHPTLEHCSQQHLKPNGTLVNLNRLLYKHFKHKDFETKKIRRSFTCQFHPELLSDLRAIGNDKAPDYSTLKKDDGVRLFVRLLYAGMQE